MKTLPSALALLVGCGVTVAAITFDGVDANPRTLRSQHAAEPTRHYDIPGPACTASSSNSFVGIVGDSETASGNASGVTSGESNAACDSDTGILSGSGNSIGQTGDKNVAAYSSIAGGAINTISAAYSFAGAGALADISGPGSFIGTGGYETFLKCSCNGPATVVTGADAFVGAGDLNVVTGNGSFIGGGGYTTASVNTSTPGNMVMGADSFIGAGDQNTVAATEAFVGSGNSNAISSAASYSAILGGLKNKVSGIYATVIGGYGNTASGSYAIVAGGNSDTASGILTYAAGYHADAAHNGSFVWSDYVSGSKAIEDSATNQFIARASGGTTFYSNEAATAGVQLSAGSGTWANLSDRNAKTGVASLDDETVLAKVAALPVKTWRYTSESGVRHIGPMAQDFYAAFGVGEDDRHITSIDEDGVALAAVKGLNTQMHGLDAQKNREIRQLRSEVSELRTDLQRLESTLAHNHR